MSWILNIEVIPQSTWGKNLRSMMSQYQWKKLSKSVRELADGKCDICCEDTEFSKLDAHEVWEWDFDTESQILTDVIAVCKPCHATIHLGRSEQLGFGKDAANQFMKVNEVGETEFSIARLESINGLHDKNSIKEWKINIDYLDKLGFKSNIE